MLRALREAAALLRDEPVRFRFVGDGVAREGLERRVKQLGLTNCTFEPSVAPEQLVALLHEADAAIATATPMKFAGETIPRVGWCQRTRASKPATWPARGPVSAWTAW